MREEFNKLPKQIRILNVIVLLFAYLTISISLIANISRTETLFSLKNWNEETVILLGVVLFLAAPFFSLLILMLILRIEHFFITGEFTWFFPKPGTLENPTIDDLIGQKGIKILNLFLKILVLLLVLTFAWLIYLELRRV